MLDGGGQERPKLRSRPSVVHVLGSRPDAVTLAPVHAALERRGTFMQSIVQIGAHTERAMVGDVLRDLGLPAPERTLRTGSGTQGAQTARALAAAERVLDELRPDVAVVTGASNSALGFALAAAKLGISVARLEAGLRANDWSVNEELNRILLDRIADTLLAPTAQAASNLAFEGIGDSRIHVVGSTVVDSVRRVKRSAGARETWKTLGLERGQYVLVTLHRVGNLDDDERLARIVEGLAALARHTKVVLPLHPRTRGRLKPMGDAHRLLTAGVLCVAPLPYVDFVSLQLGAGAIVTDSATVQEESTVLGVPCHTIGSVTERVVTLTHGTNALLGDDPRDIADVRPSSLPSTPSVIPLWDGSAGERAAAALVANYAIVRAHGAS
jgi:UDP-N-acetylglucosamine 2-epimerase (non-hydrolysing)